MLGQFVDAVQRCLEAPDDFVGTDPAEFARAADGQQVQADVGRRRAVRQQGVGDELQVVGRQVVVLSPDAALEKTPGVARQRHQVALVAGIQRMLRAGRARLAGPPRRNRRCPPEQKQEDAGPRMDRPGRGHDQRGAQQRRCSMLLHEHEKLFSRRRLRLRRSGPFHQPAAADAHAPDGTQRRVQQQHRLRRYLAELPGSGAQGDAQLGPSALEKVAPGNAGVRWHQAGQRAQQRPGQQRGNDRQQCGAQGQCAGEDHPDKQCERGRQHQRAAQIVQHFPRAERIDAVAPGVPEQRNQLPVAACPAVVAHGGHAGMVRRVFNQHHVADKAAARNAAFEQVVAEHRFIGQALIQHGMQSPDMQQALAAETAGAEQVLVDIGGAAAVGIDAALAGKQPVVGGVFRTAGQGRDHAGLQDAVAADHPAQTGVYLWRVQRMGGNGDQLAQRARRQAGIAVQRDHVADALGQPQGRSQRQEAFHAAGGQQAHQLLKLAALAFPAEPALLGLAPAARPVNQQEARRSARACRIACVQRFQPGQRIVQQAGVSGQAGVGRIDPVGEQGKLGFAFPIGQPVKLQLLQQFVAGLRGCEQRRDHHQHPVLRRNAGRKAQARQRLDLQRLGNQAVHKSRSGLESRTGQQEKRHQGLPAVPVGMARGQCHHHQRRQRDAADVQAQPPPAPVQALPGALRRHAQVSFQSGSAVAHQVKACGSLGGVCCQVGRHRLGRRHHCLGHLLLGFSAVARQLLHGPGDLLSRAFAFAGKAGQVPQHLQGAADGLDQLDPVNLANRAQRGDDVANRQVGRDLGALAFQHQRMAIGAVFLDPAHHGGRIA